MAIAKTSRGHRVRYEVKRTFSTEAEAKRFEKVLRAHFQAALVEFDRGDDSPTILSHLEEWLADLSDNGTTLKRIDHCRDVLLRTRYELMIDRDDVALDEITKAMLKDWRHRRRNTACASTVNGEVAILKAYANWAVDEERWTPGIRGLRWLNLQRLAHKTKQPDPVTEAEFGHITKQLPLQISLPWIFQWLSADRPGAWQALNWEHITLPDVVVNTETGEIDVRCNGHVRLRKRKGGAGNERVIAFEYGDTIHSVLDAARRFFTQTRGRAPRWYDPVFISSRALGQRWSGAGFNSALKYHLARAGLRPVCPYTARHSVASSLAKHGANAHQTQAALGHRDFRTTDNYIHMSGEDQTAAHSKISSLLSPHIGHILAPQNEGEGGQEAEAENSPGLLFETLS